MPPPGSLLENLKSLPAPAWVLFGGTFINRFGTFVMPFLVIYLTKAGYTPAQAGLAISAYGIGHLIASMVGGYLADHIGRRHTIALSMFASAAAMVALSQARGLPVVMLLAFCAGLAGELYRPAAGALIGDLIQAEQRVFAFGMYRWAINLGFAAGPATAGFLADRSFLFIFLGDAVTSAVYGVIALFALPHGVRGSSKEESPVEGYRVAMRDSKFVRFLVATLCIALVEMQCHSTLPLYVTSLGYSSSTYGLLLSINGVLIIVFELLITMWTQRRAPRPVIALGYVLAAIGFALTGLATNIPMLAATVVIWTLGEMIYAPSTGAYVSNLAPERYRGRYQGLFWFTWSTGMVFGPLLGTMIFERNQAVLWSSCAVLGVLSAALMLRKERAPLPQAVAES